ncbi:MAG: hypothetical protein WB676_00615, partial [Bryobacteraceae bacterium]
EDFKVVPGDLVSFYATASDAKSTSRTDMFFALAEPFDLRFQQSQQSAGGGGGMGNESSDISQRQKEIIAATWNELRNGATEKNAATEEAHFLSDVEGKLGEQAKTLADRMRSRELSGSNAEFDEFSKQMDRASAEMGNAVGQLKGEQWRDALAPEQRALQALTRAESLFKDIQVAYGRMNGGGSMGGAGSAGRDLERMFDLELDPEKNQYETGESASSQSQQQKDLQDALERLKELARRQQELAAQRQPQQSSQDRWEQEMLRREAEQLQRQMQQLSQNQQQSQSGQQSSSQSGSQSSSASSSSSSRSSQQRSQQSAQSAGARPSNQQLEQAANALQRAEEEMRNAVSQHDASAQQRAAADLQAAEQQLREMQRQQAGNSISNLAAQAQDMLEHQKDFSNRLRQAASSQNGEGNDSDAANDRFAYGGRWNRDPYDPTRRSLPSGTNRQIDRLADEGQQMADQLDRLQRAVQHQAQSLAGGQPQVSSKLRDAVSGIQQQDLASHMKKNADWIRQGYAKETWVNEQGATLTLDQFNRQMQEAEQLARNTQPANGNGQPGDDTERALQQVEQLRRDLSQQSSQPGNSTARSGGMMPGGRPAIAEAMQNIASLRRQLGPRSGRAYYDSEYAYRFLNDLQNADPGELAARLNREVLPALQRLEVDLKKQAKMPPDASRLAASEPTPEAYSDAVAEYFKKLSK